MELEAKARIQQNKDKISPQAPPYPRINGTKPAEILRISEDCKKHIRRDGRK